MGKKKSHTKRYPGSNDASSSKKSDLIAVSGLGISSLADDSNVCAVVDEGECAPSSSSAPSRDSGVVVEKVADGSDNAFGSSNGLIVPNFSDNENGIGEHDGGNSVVVVAHNGTNLTADAPSSSYADELALTDDTPFIGNLSIELNDDNESGILAASLSVGNDTHQPSSMIGVQHPSGMHEWNNSETTLVQGEVADQIASHGVAFDGNQRAQQPRDLSSINVDDKRVVIIDEDVTTIEENATSDKRKIVRFASALEVVISSFARIDTEATSGSETETRVQWSSVLSRYILNRSCCCKVDRHDGTT